MATVIMLIEDDEDFGMLVTRTLKIAGYDVLWAKDGVHGLSMAKQSNPALIITDFMFPAGGGATLYQRLRMLMQTVATPVLFLSAAPRELVSGAVPPGSDAYFLAKPYKKEELLAVVAQMLKGEVEEKHRLTPPQEEAPPAAVPVKGVVMVVEEDKETCAVIKSTLEKSQYKVMEVHDGAEASSYFGLSGAAPSAAFIKPGLIIMDAALPQIDGYELNARLIENPATRSIPVMIVTDKRELRDRFANFPNVIRYMDKPVDAQQLEKHVGSIIK